jgi:hypothetical protein
MPQIYHITHVSNLARIIGGLLSDRRVLLTNAAPEVIGFDHIKKRRLEELLVPCCPGTTVGDFVPFYFCPRSVMLYVIERRGGDLRYKGGQQQIVHLVSSVKKATQTGQDWAFSDGNAGARYTNFSNQLDQMDELLQWNHIQATDWRDPAVKDKKQAEFLVRDQFAWTAIEEIGVINNKMAATVEEAVADASYCPPIRVHRDWYY